MNQLRQYQQDCSECVARGFHAGFMRQLVVMATGGGKTPTFAHIANRFYSKRQERTLVLAHREELISQAADKIERATGLIPSVEKANQRADRTSPVVVASIQTMQGARLETWDKEHFGLIVCDEAHHCFPYATKILTSAGMVMIGDLVKYKMKLLVASVDLDNNRREWMPISNWFTNKTDNLLLITHEHGVITCTENHKIWTNGGYVRAKDIVSGMYLQVVRERIQTDKRISQTKDILRQKLQWVMDSIKAASARTVVGFGKKATNCEKLRMVQGGVFQTVKRKGFEIAKILFSKMRPRFHSEYPESKDDPSRQHLEDAQCCHRDEEAGYYGKNESQQSDEKSRVCGKNEAVIIRQNIPVERRERKDYGSSRNDSQEDESSNGICHINSWSKGSVPVASVMLQSGPCDSRNENSNRSGRENPLEKKLDILGREKDFHTEPSRVVSVEVYKSGSASRFGCSSGENQFLYDLEVEKNHNYFADGVLVSNCLADQWQKTLSHFTSRVLGVTATPDRGDRKNLATYFDNLAYEIGILELIKQKFLAPVRIKSVPLKIDLADVKITSGDFDANALDAAIKPYLSQIARYIADECQDRKRIVAFLPLISTSMLFVDECRKVGIDARHIDGADKDRKQILQDYSDGKFRLLSNAMLLTEGWDEPGVDCLLVLRPTRSRALYAQMVGRGTRIAPDKDHLLLLDFLWLHERHDLARPASLVAKTKDEQEAITAILEGSEKDLSEAVQDAAAEREAAIIRQIAENASRRERFITLEQIGTVLKEEKMRDYSPTFKWETAPVSEKQQRVLDGFGIACRTKGEANMVLNRIFDRSKAKLATIKQLVWLVRFKHPSPDTCTQADAKAFLDEKFSRK